MQKTNIHSFHVKTLGGKEFRFDSLKGRNVLLVNTASVCGYTPQYKQLQELHEKHGKQVTVIGIPCNDFGGQEPGSAEEIGEFCSLNFGVTFTLLEKMQAKGEQAHPLFRWLSDKELNGVNDIKPQWNFGKYVICKNGELIHYFAPPVSPLDEELLALVLT